MRRFGRTAGLRPHGLRGTFMGAPQQQLMSYGGAPADSGPYYTEVMDDTPLMYLRLRDPSGTTAVDSSGNARNGTYVDSPTLNQTGLLDNEDDACASFNGTTQYATVGYGSWMNTGQVFSAEGLIYPTSVSDTLLARRQGGTASTRVFGLRGNPSMVLGLSGTEYDYRLHADSAPPTGVRSHVVGTYNNGRLKLYRNGLLRFDCTRAWTLPQPTSSQFSSMAIDLAGTPSDFGDGKCDEVAFYSTELSAARVKAHAEAAGITVTDYTYDGIASTARGQYALRAINGYTGALIDVRRSSDNATRTINVSAGELDTSDLATWGGSDSVYVSKWYDQSGNGHHMVQATNAAQGRIVNAGTLETINSNPVINFIAGTYAQESTSLIGTSDSVTILKATETAGFGRGATGGAGWSIAFSSTEHLVVFTGIGTSSYSVTGTDSTSFGAQTFRITNISGGSTLALARDVGGIEQNTGSSIGNYNFRTSTVGCTIGRVNGTDRSGKVGELLVWRSVLDHGEQQAVIANLATRFGF